MHNRIFSLLLVLLLLLSVTALPVFAQELLSTTRIGTITVTVPDDRGEINGAVTLYRVADLSLSSEGTCEFEYTRDFAAANLPLENLESPELSLSLAAYAAENAIRGETGTFDRNTVVFHCTAGLYLVVHTGAVEGENTFVPFLVTLPGTENGEPDYDVSASPKVGPTPDVPEWTEIPTESEPETTPPTPNEEQLPQTGQLNWPVPMLAVAGMGLFAVGWALRFNGREEDYEA